LIKLLNKKYDFESTQDKEPSVMEYINKVGVSNILTKFKVNYKSKIENYTGNIDVYIDLKENKKGIHMSRIIESINEVIESNNLSKSIEEVGLRILDTLRSKHEFNIGEININTHYFITKSTINTKKFTHEAYEITISVIKENNRDYKKIRTAVIGNTLCPHSLNMTKGKSHIQRAQLIVEIKTEYDSNIDIEKIINKCEDSFTTPTYTLLKSPDEAELVDKMFDNGKFVEDVVRECYVKINNMKIKGEILIKIISNESIHKHNAIAQIHKKIGY